MNLPREPFYEKELSFNLSRSYGPGRYDINYEEKGQDYPIGFVRWTEKRNMEAILKLIEKNKLDIQKLITDTFPFSEAPRAYEKIKEAKASVTGALLEYNKKIDIQQKLHLTSLEKKNEIGKSRINIGFIGAGSYAQKFLLPYLAKDKRVNFTGLSTATGMNADHIGKKYGFEYITTGAEDIIRDESINCIVIATRHNLHAKFVIAALEMNKHVYVEKPLAIQETELEEIKGIGEVTIKALLKHFKYVKNIKVATNEQLLEVVNQKQAKAISDFYN
jgi:polar amino acid transport system substrate-binding protein